LYIGFGIGWTLYDDEYYGFEEFVFSVVSWPFAIFEPLLDSVFDAFDWICDSIGELFDAVCEQIEDIFDWVIEHTFGRFEDASMRRYHQSIKSKNSVNIQAGGDIRVDGENFQARDRSQRKNKKSPEIVDLQKNLLD